MIHEFDITLDETMLEALRNELALHGYGAAPGREPEAMLIAWAMLHFKEIADGAEPELPAAALAMSLAEATLRIREEAIEIIRPHCVEVQ